MNASYFAEYVKKWFKILTNTITERLNDSKRPVAYLFKTMLKPTLSADGKWDSLSVSKSIVAADIVDIDSPVPIKKRDAISRAGGEIPMIGMGMKKNAKLIQRIKYLANSGATELQVCQMIFDDLTRVISGMYERVEMMFLQGLSTGIVLAKDDSNVGVGIRINFGYKESNTYGATIKWGCTGYTPISDIERVLTKASENSDVITTIALDKVAYNQVRRSEEAKSLYAASIGNYTGNNQIIPTPSQFDEIISDEYKVKFLIIDRVVRVEKNGKQTNVRPFAENTLVFLTTEQVGSLVYSLLAEQDAEYRVKNVDYQIVDNFILISKYSETNPLQEFTNGQAIVLPVIENVDSIYILNTQEGQEVDNAEVEGDSTITIYGETYVKTEVINALKEAGFRIAYNISDGKLIDKINELSNEDEAKVKAAIEKLTPYTPPQT
ncbi:MAG: major capsid protein [Prevotellaceae bacterium]|jgi:hypothetical protein|nr:major capsid protein [Prevotellaceae bacterium]